MRTPPNIKYFLLFLLAIAIISLATIYLPKLIPNIGNTLMVLLIACMCLLMCFVVIKYFINFLYARADSILKIFIDESELAIHIFSTHLNSGGEYFSNNTRDIQHYLVMIGSGKLYMKTMFSHSMEPDSGRSGWGGFYGFEESVLGTEHLKKSLEKLSIKTKLNLKLGREINPLEEHVYEIHIKEKVLSIKKYHNVADEGFQIICADKLSGKIDWKKRI